MRKEKAINKFSTGLNCAQSVLLSFADDLGLSENQAALISSAFGAGMGRLQQTCGAVTGSFMVIGMKNGYQKGDELEKKETLYKLVKEFRTCFENELGSINCGELLKCDLNTDEGKKIFKETNRHKNVCEKCVFTAVEILEKILK